METKIVSSGGELDLAVKDAVTRGLKLAAVSNAGLSDNRVRLTFLPAEAFKKPLIQHPKLIRWAVFLIGNAAFSVFDGIVHMPWWACMIIGGSYGYIAAKTFLRLKDIT